VSEAVYRFWSYHRTLLREESMRYPTRAPALLRPLIVGTLSALLVATPTSAPAQSVKDAHKRQADFEMFRQSRIPVEREQMGGGCDAQIGRICIWFGGDEESNFPPETPDVTAARGQLIQFLAATAEAGGDFWVIGQQVRYLVEQGNAPAAERVAAACGIEETWWCSALGGYSLHVRGRVVEAEAAFREALAAMPKKEREQWLTADYILAKDGRKAMDRGTPDERERRWELFWRLSDPLILVEGNDRMTDHFARLVEARNEKDSENPQGMFWDVDMEEVLIRYGRIVGWSRTFAPQRTMGFGGGVQDTRRVTGHHQPRSRGYLFPDAYLVSPSDIPPESWITAPREARTWYAPPYAPDFRGLETQVGRFRRGDEMLVVGAYRPDPPEARAGDSFSGGINSPFAGAVGSVEAGLVLVPEDGGATTQVLGTDAAGVFTLRAPPGRYVSSLEVLDARGNRAWRARQGVKQVPMVEGLVAVSDVLILEPGASLPTTMEEAVPLVRQGVRVRQGERFTVVWEVYGLRVQDPAKVTFGFTKGRPGFMTEVGDFLGNIEPDRTVEVTFDDPGADGVQSAFRSVVLQLPELEPGDYTLHIRVDLPGRSPAMTSRPIVVEG